MSIELIIPLLPSELKISMVLTVTGPMRESLDRCGNPSVRVAGSVSSFWKCAALNLWQQMTSYLLTLATEFRSRIMPERKVLICEEQ